MTTRAPRLVDLVELVRAPAALTMPGDTLAGAAAARWPGGARASLLLPLASTCLYWAGMALNDWADRDQDRLERPERPIPSGRVAPRTALGVAAGLTAAGVTVAGVAGGAPAAGVAATLAAAVWAYDLGPKTGALGAATMASTRGLDVLLGAAAGGWPGLRCALGPAALVAGHTASVTVLSRGEVHGSTSATAWGSVAATIAMALGATVTAARPLAGGAPYGRSSRCAALVSGGLSGLYAASVVAAQVRAARRPDGPTVRAATGAGIRGLVPLQGALAAAAGAPAVGLGVAASAPLGRWAMRTVSPT